MNTQLQAAKKIVLSYWDAIDAAGKARLGGKVNADNQFGIVLFARMGKHGIYAHGS